MDRNDFREWRLADDPFADFRDLLDEDAEDGHSGECDGGRAEDLDRSGPDA